MPDLLTTFSLNLAKTVFFWLHNCSVLQIELESFRFKTQNKRTENTWAKLEKFHLHQYLHHMACRNPYITYKSVFHRISSSLLQTRQEATLKQISKLLVSIQRVFEKRKLMLCITLFRTAFQYLVGSFENIVMKKIFHCRRFGKITTWSRSYFGNKGTSAHDYGTVSDDDIPDSLLKHILAVVLQERVSEGDNFLLYMPSHSTTSRFERTPLILPRPTTKAPQTVSYYKKVFSFVFSPRMSRFDMAEHNLNFFQYISQVYSETMHSKEVLIITLIYLDRYTCNCPDNFMRSSNAMKLFGTAFMLAAKWHEDNSHFMAEYSYSLDFDPGETASLEREFLAGINYDLFVSEREFLIAKEKLLAAALDSSFGPHFFLELGKLNESILEKALSRVRKWIALVPEFKRSTYSPFFARTI